MGGAPQVAMRVTSQIWQIIFASQTLQVFCFCFANPLGFSFGPSQKGTICSSEGFKFYHKGLKKVNAMLQKEEGKPLVALETKDSCGLKLDDSHLQVKMVVQVNLKFLCEKKILVAIGTCVGGFFQHDDVERFKVLHT